MTEADFEKIRIEARESANQNIRFGFILGFITGVLLLSLYVLIF